MFAQEASQGAEIAGLVVTGGVIAGLGYVVWRTRQRAQRDYWDRKRRERTEEERRRRRMRGEADPDGE